MHLVLLRELGRVICDLVKSLPQCMLVLEALPDCKKFPYFLGACDNTVSPNSFKIRMKLATILASIITTERSMGVYVMTAMHKALMWVSRCGFHKYRIMQPKQTANQESIKMSKEFFAEL